jgi:hypothetical protein
VRIFLDERKKRPVWTARHFANAVLTAGTLSYSLDYSANTVSVMSNIPVAFLVLGAFFTLYFVAALWRSRPK